MCGKCYCSRVIIIDIDKSNIPGDRGDLVDGISLDFQKAIDKAPDHMLHLTLAV